MPALSELRDSPAAVAAAEAWRWWTGELKAMLPDRLRPDAAGGSRADIRPRPGSVEIEIVRDGVGQRFADSKPLDDLDEDGWAELAALIEGSRSRILLESPDMFATSLTLPKLARRRLRSAVSLQLSQLAPLEPSLLRWASRSADSGPDRIQVMVAMARADRVARLQELFEINGLSPPPVFAAAGDEPLQLAAGRRVAVDSSHHEGARPWIVAAILIASIPLTTALGATMLRSSAESRISVLEKSATPRLREESNARRSEELRRGLRPLVGRPSVSATLEDLATRLPMSDHVVSVRQSGERILDLTVEAAEAETVEAALKGSPLLPNLTVADIAPTSAGRFNVTLRTTPR
jgi:hypothetical protein